MESEGEAVELPEKREERRASPRLAVEEPAAIVILEEGVGFRCSVLDLSLSGCRLHTSLRFPGSAWDRVEISFKLRGISLRFSGEIQWIDGRQKVGIRFINLTPRRRTELAEVLAEIKAYNDARIEREAEEKQAAGIGAMPP
ncbi:MAG: PilZ domain-containing protein, partial [Terracidiphilus sp.]